MGVSIVFGGQWGSEGKGKTTYYFSKKFNVSAAVRVGGPNSGHTVVDENGERKVFQILPVASILDGVTCVLPAGAYINLKILMEEVRKSGIDEKLIKINPNAVLINQDDIRSEKALELNDRIGSTESGTGMAVISRIRRESSIILASKCKELSPYICDTTDYLRDELRKNHEIIIEGTQGFGLSVLHASEYPYVTSRDTSAAGFLSETGLSPFDVKNVIMTLRAFPIRVAGNSGALPNECSWDEVTQIAGAPIAICEKTTVTKRVRRVARFDNEIVKKSIVANKPNIVVLNHCDYFDYAVNNKSLCSDIIEKEVINIENQIGKVNYIGIGDRILIDR